MNYNDVCSIIADKFYDVHQVDSNRWVINFVCVIACVHYYLGIRMRRRGIECVYYSALCNCSSDPSNNSFYNSLLATFSWISTHGIVKYTIELRLHLVLYFEGLFSRSKMCCILLVVSSVLER